MEVEGDLELFSDASDLIATSPERAAKMFEALLKKCEFDEQEELEEQEEGQPRAMHPGQQTDEAPKLSKEQIVYRLVDCYGRLQDAQALVDLLKHVRQVGFEQMSKSKSAKLVRMIIDELGRVPNSAELQVEICKEYIEWCVVEKRSFLRQRLQARLASLLLQRNENQEALNLLRDLQVEIRRLDDKPLLVEIFLQESKAHLALRNLPKSKASLTAARAAANAIYVAPQTQAEIDMQGGSLNASDRDFRTAYSYFFEAFETYSQLGVGSSQANREFDRMAAKALKYMVLCKIMQGLGDDLAGIFNAKASLKHLGPEMEAMKHVATAYKERSLALFAQAWERFPNELGGDEMIVKHLTDLQSSLLEANLVRIVEPYSRVHVSRVAELINLPVAKVEAKLSQMILDKKFSGILDQGEGMLLVFDEPEPDASYDASLRAISSMGTVVDSLFRRAEKLHT